MPEIVYDIEDGQSQINPNAVKATQQNIFYIIPQPGSIVNIYMPGTDPHVVHHHHHYTFHLLHKYFHYYFHFKKQRKHYHQASQAASSDNESPCKGK